MLLTRLKSFHHNQQGQAIIEGVAAVVVLISILLVVMLVGAYGDAGQRASMGARVLAFGAGDKNFAWPSAPDKAHVNEFGFAPGGLPDQESKKAWNNIGFGSGFFIEQLLEALSGERKVRISDGIRGMGPAKERFGFEWINMGFSSGYSCSNGSWRGEQLLYDGVFSLVGLAIVLSPWSVSLENLGGPSGRQIDPRWRLDDFFKGGLEPYP